MKKTLLLLFVFVAGIAASGCEDDPILSPRTEAKQGGSYGRTSLPPGTSDSTAHLRQRELPLNPILF